MTVRKEIPRGLQIVPSLLSADFARLVEEVRSIEGAGVQMLHLDVMDGDFVPEITFGPLLVRSIRSITDLFLDTHLMIRRPLALLDRFAGSGADLLTLHAEVLDALPTGSPGREGVAAVREALGRLRPQGCGLGLSFKPATDPVPWLEEVGEVLDLVLVMTVEPGFAGQAFMSEQMSKVEAVRRLREQRGWRYRIEVDGGVGAETARACVSAGAELLVAGSAVFGREDRSDAVAAIRRAAAGAEADPGGGV